MMEWIPVVFIIFKVLVLCTGMYFAIKWHYDQGQKVKALDKRALILAAGKVAAIFLILLLGLGYVTLLVIRKLGMDFSFT